jgi:hypothetical protein
LEAPRVIEAQRIGALPEPELRKAFAEARQRDV